MTEKLKLPIGLENFEEIRKSGFYYVDKTKLIEQLLEEWGKVNLFTRPRRFGKTLNMSMLRYFFEVGTDKTTKKGNSPKSYISFTEAKSEAEAIYNSESYGVKSSLPSGSAWNSTAKWIVNSKAESWNGVFNDSTSWGNYRLSISQRSSKINRK